MCSLPCEKAVAPFQVCWEWHSGDAVLGLRPREERRFPVPFFAYSYVKEIRHESFFSCRNTMTKAVISSSCLCLQTPSGRYVTSGPWSQIGVDSGITRRQEPVFSERTKDLLLSYATRSVLSGNLYKK